MRLRGASLAMPADARLPGESSGAGMGFLNNIRNDLAFARGIWRTLRRVIPMARNRTRTFPDFVEELAAKYGERPALLSSRETLSYAGFNARANRYARWAMRNGVKKGDV